MTSKEGGLHTLATCRTLWVGVCLETAMCVRMQGATAVGDGSPRVAFDAVGDISARSGAFDAVGDRNPVPGRFGCPRPERCVPGRVECPRPHCAGLGEVVEAPFVGGVLSVGAGRGQCLCRASMVGSSDGCATQGRGFSAWDWMCSGAASWCRGVGDDW